MVDYSKFKGIKRRKRRNYRYLSLNDNESGIYTFTGIRSGKRQNPWSGKTEEVWFISLKDQEGNGKKWVTGSLAVYGQFEGQDIQEGDRVKITKRVERNRTRYLVEKLALEKKVRRVGPSYGDIPIVEDEE